jgi:hypothetical protein
MMRYQHPLTSGLGLKEVQPVFIFDGSLGLVRKLENRFALGLYWYGQFQRYRYRAYDPLNDADISGTQTLLISNLEARLGIFF